MFTFRQLKDNPQLFDQMGKTCPFIEIYCDPCNDYKISWFYPHQVPIDEQLLISRYFKKDNFVNDNDIEGFLGFLEESSEFPLILIRPEVREKVEKVFEKQMMNELRKNWVPDFSEIKADLFPCR
jgi:hypothetical protein